MSRVNPDELSASMVVLGLVIERPNATVKEVGQLVRSRFPRARFASTTAHNALPQLAKKTRDRPPYLVCHPAPGRGSDPRSLDRYSPNRHGLRGFRAWMYDLYDDEVTTIGRPALREAMLGRIELAQLKDLPRLIQMARTEALVSADLYAVATEKLRDLVARRGDPHDFERQIREVLLYVDPLHWSARSERYRQIANRLEDIKQAAEAAGLKFGGG